MKNRCEHRIVIAGNHEVSFDPATAGHSEDKNVRTAISRGEIKRPSDLLTNCTYLEVTSIRLIPSHSTKIGSQQLNLKL